MQKKTTVTIYALAMMCVPLAAQENVTEKEERFRRQDEWLQVSLKSLHGFASMENTIDTSDLLVHQTADLIMRKKAIRQENPVVLFLIPLRGVRTDSWTAGDGG